MQPICIGEWNGGDSQLWRQREHPWSRGSATSFVNFYHMHARPNWGVEKHQQNCYTTCLIVRTEGIFSPLSHVQWPLYFCSDLSPGWKPKKIRGICQKKLFSKHQHFVALHFQTASDTSDCKQLNNLINSISRQWVTLTFTDWNWLSFLITGNKPLSAN